MIVFIDEEGSYISWVAHHRNGFVIDWQRQPTKKHPIVHRASCSEIRAGSFRKTRWTTGRRLKACSVDLKTLLTWAQNESPLTPEFCKSCQPDEETQPVSDSSRKPTRLEKEILDYVLEVAIIHLDNLNLTYNLTIGDVAQSLGKTTGQIANAISGLIENGLLNVDIATGKTELQGTEPVFPTCAALKTEPAFKKLTDREIARELAVLQEDAD